MNNRASKVLQSVLKTAVCYLDQSGEVAGRVSEDARARVASGIDRAGEGISGLRDRAHDLYYGEDHTGRNVLLFLVGLGVGVGAGVLLAPASGEETRDAIGDKVEEFRGQVRDRFKSKTGAATGTEGI